VSQAKRQAGVVLIVVLWVVALLAVLLMGFVAVAKVERDTAADVVRRGEARVSAEAVLAYLSAMHALGGDEWKDVLGQVLNLPLSGRVVFRVLPEDSFVSLNGASRETLVRFFGGSAAMPNADLLADYIVARRTAINGAESAEAEGGRPWVSVNELLLIEDINPSQLQPVLGWLTVDSRHDGVNQRFAPSALIRVLYPEQAEAILSARRSGEAVAGAVASSGAAVSAGGGLGADMARERRRLLSGGGAPAFRVQVEAGPANAVRRIEAVVRFEGGDSGYQVLRWSEYNASFTFDD
jgi:hypothetical protein